MAEKVNPTQMKKDVANGVMIGRVTWAALIDHALELEGNLAAMTKARDEAQEALRQAGYIRGA